MIHLTGLTQYSCLNPTSTKVTAAGVKQLQPALPKCQVFQ
jgi:hypothetical protein